MFLLALCWKIYKSFGLVCRVVLELIFHFFSYFLAVRLPILVTRAKDLPFLEENRAWTNLALARDFIFLATRRLWKIRYITRWRRTGNQLCLSRKTPNKSVASQNVFLSNTAECGNFCYFSRNRRAVTRHFDTFCSLVFRAALSFRLVVVVNKENKYQIVACFTSAWDRSEFSDR